MSKLYLSTVPLTSGRNYKWRGTMRLLLVLLAIFWVVLQFVFINLSLSSVKLYKSRDMHGTYDFALATTSSMRHGFDRARNAVREDKKVAAASQDLFVPDPMTDKGPRINIHSNFPCVCGKTLNTTSELHPAIEGQIRMVLDDPPPAKQWKYKINSVGHVRTRGQIASAIQDLVKIQVCQYATLDKWRQVATNNDFIWAAHGGSAMSAKCYGAMNPWDDDIDITVAECSKLDAIWDAGTNVHERYPHLKNFQDRVFSTRLIEVDGDGEGWLLSKGRVVDKRCCNYFKLRPVSQISAAPTGKDLSGIDIMCLDRPSWDEKGAKADSGFLQYMKDGGKLDNVMYGPTTIQVVPHKILDRYIYERYGKVQPCAFPFGSGDQYSRSSSVKSNLYVASAKDTNSANGSQLSYLPIIRESNMDYAMATWYTTRAQREGWLRQVGNGKGNMLSHQEISNLNRVEIDNSIAHDGACNWGAEGTLKVVEFNAERGTHWEKFSEMVSMVDALRDADIIILNEMDIGMARSGNVHTTRRLALALGMNYAWGLEFIELTRGTKEEQDSTKGDRNSLGLHGNSILCKCRLYDPVVFRDDLPDAYFAKQANRFNAGGYEKRLGGRMGLFVRMSEAPTTTSKEGEKQYFLVGSVHKLERTKKLQSFMYEHFGFGTPPQGQSAAPDVRYPKNQLGVIFAGDFAHQLCQLGGTFNVGNPQHKTWPARCGYNGRSRGDHVCSNMIVTQEEAVTSPCYSDEMGGKEKSGLVAPTIALSDHAIISISLRSPALASDMHDKVQQTASNGRTEVDLNHREFAENTVASLPCKRIVVGIFTTMQEIDIALQKKRLEGMKYHRVNEALACGINMVFVVGIAPTKLRHKNEMSPSLDHTVFLNITENLNDGKAFEWLNAATSQFPDADFIYKMDMDTQICSSALADLTREAISNGQDYVGYQIDRTICGGRPHCPQRRDHQEHNWWYYMAGAIYGLSKPLAKSVTSSKYAQENKAGHEDLMVGKWVHMAAPQTKPYHVDCLYKRTGKRLITSGEPCAIHHWQHHESEMVMDDSLCDSLVSGWQMPWVKIPE